MAKGWFEAKDPSLGKARRHSEVQTKRKMGSTLRRQAVKKDWKKVAKRELERELGVKTKVSSYDFFEDLGALALGSISGEANNGEREWIVFSDHDTAEKAAVAQVKENLESEPSLFNQDWLQGHIEISETDKNIMAGEEADNYVDEVLDEDGIIREADIGYDIEQIDGKISDLEIKQEHVDEELEEGVINKAEHGRLIKALQDEIDALKKKREKEIDDAKERLRETKTQEIYDALEDPIQYFVHDRGIYSVNDLMKMPWISIDVEEASEDAVDTDGVDHFLDNYDGCGVELPSGAIAYGTN